MLKIDKLKLFHTNIVLNMINGFHHFIIEWPRTLAFDGDVADFVFRHN